MYVKYKGNKRKVNADAKNQLYITLHGKKLYLSKIADKIDMVQRGGCTIREICMTNANNIKRCIVNISFDKESQFAEYNNLISLLRERASQEDKLLYQVTETDPGEFMKFMIDARSSIPNTELHILPSNVSPTNIGFLLTPKDIVTDMCKKPSPTGPLSFSCSECSSDT
jgi:hypothetical protein